MNSPKFSLIFFLLSSAFIVFNGGYFAREQKLFPYQLYKSAYEGWKQVTNQNSEKLPWFYNPTDRPASDIVRNISQAQPGLSLVTEMAAEKNLSAKIIDLEGNTLQKWNLDWFELWPDPQHLPKSIVPKAKPGTNVHGAVVMENGDLVFNFESMGLVRLDRNNEVVWRLPYLTHHSIHQHDDGNLWISGRKYHTEEIDRLPNLIPPFFEETIVEVSPEGKLLREWYVADILRKNNYGGLSFLGTLNNDNTTIQGEDRLLGRTDIFHMNDVETFPTKLDPGFFQPGDVMVSLRNINTVFVFNVETEKIKYMSTGQVVRQHDPDFIDGDTISIFDNNNARAPKRKSKITIVSAKDNSHQVYFDGTKDNEFYTRVMGKHQWLPNGNLLITESMTGRGLEINPQGEVVWEYINYIEPSMTGIVTEVQRLSPEYTEVFTQQE